MRAFGHNPRRLRPFASLLLAAIAVGCGGSAETGATSPSVLSSIIVTVAPASLAIGETATATASGYDQRGQPYAINSFAWSASNSAIATVSTSGVVNGVAPGQTTIIGSALGVQGQQIVTITGVPKGTLAVTISGLPTGAGTPIVTITGPGGYSTTLHASQTLTDLSVGQYTITTKTIIDSRTGLAYGAKPQTITVAANAFATAMVAYANTTGTLSLTITGLPQSARVTITITEPSGESFRLDTNATLVISNYPEGTYTLSAPSVTFAGTTYTPTPPSQSAVLRAGVATPVTFAFIASGG